jgi:hypothetical protein
MCAFYKSGAFQEPRRSKTVYMTITLNIHARPSVIDRSHENNLPKAQTAYDIELSPRAFA